MTTYSMKPLSFLILLAIAACHAPASKNIDYKHAYILTGTIEGLPEGVAFLQHRERNGLIDKAVIEDGVFTFTGVADSPEYCSLGFLVNGNMDFRLGFFLQNGKIELSGRRDSLQEEAVRITGSPAEDEYRSVSNRLAAINGPGATLSDRMSLAINTNDKALEDSVQQAAINIRLQQKEYVRSYARQHPSSYVAAYELHNFYSSNADAKELDSVYGGLADAIKTSWYGQRLKGTLEKAQLTDIGKAAPGFSLPDADGRDIALSSFKGKFVLVDFWASWCGPCRRENPNYLKAWQRFHPKGFDILGVSLDNSRDKWLDAVKKDQLPWTQLADLNGWQNQAATLYGIRGIPMNYLLDQEGKIIAKGLRGEELERQLTTLMR